ncbi:tubulin-like doman-containing protein [Methylobacterium sp. A54F]
MSSSMPSSMPSSIPSPVPSPDPAAVELGERRLPVRPTVFVALGGTGKEVLLRLRRRILGAEWNGTRLESLADFPAAAFLYLDTDTAEARESDRAARTDPLAAKVAFTEGETLQRAVDLARYQAERRRYPEIDAWLPTHDLSRIDAAKGAGQVRCIARLLFFDARASFVERVAAQAGAVLANLTNEARLSALGLSVGTDLRIVVVASAAGGTGSGAFLDAGYALSGLASPARPASVELFLVLPSGYAGANRARVFANGFAALSELEYTMRGAPEPPYAAGPDAPAARPFSEVYLFDTHNLADQRTASVADLHEMIADVLFEDFGNSDFAAAKRSVGVNQTQHKMRPWVPPLPAEAGGAAAAYALGYSSLGQAVLATRGSLAWEAEAAEAMRAVVEDAFGLGPARPLPGPEARDRFLAERLGLRFSAFDRFPAVLRPEPPAIAEYDLIGRLLQRPDGSSIADDLALAVEAAVEAIRTAVGPTRDWPAALRAVSDGLREDILGRVGQAGLHGPRGAEVAAARARLETAWLGPEGEIAAALDRILDDPERGGLAYALALLVQVREAIEAEDGAARRLAAAADAHGRHADAMLSEHFSASLARLSAVRAGRLFSHRADAEAYLDQARADLRDAAQFRLRALAAGEAAVLLRRVAAALGGRVAGPEGAPARYDGWLGLLLRGRAEAERLVAGLAQEAAEIRATLARPSGGTFLVLPAGDLPPAPEDAGAREAGREAVRVLGGVRAGFGLLSGEAGRTRVLAVLRGHARGRLAPRRAALPTAAQALRAMPPAARREALETMLARAMPWIQARFEAFRPAPDQFKLIVAVAGARAFAAEFGPTLTAALPARLGGVAVGYCESGVTGRIVCTCELSGIPLDVLAPLRPEWRAAYAQELDRLDAIPLHNHRDFVRFPDPALPTSAEIARARADLGLFLRAACLGVIRRDGAGLYRFEFEPGDRRSIGAERTLRRRAFDPGQAAAVAARVAAVEAGLASLQRLALGALLGWTGRRAYAPRRRPIRHDAEDRVGGLAHAVALDLAGHYRRAAALPEAEALEARLLDGLEAWTRPIDGSLADIDPAEASRDPEDPPELRATDKRRIDPEGFAPEALARLVGEAGPARPAPPPAARLYVFRGAAVEGPLALGELLALARAGVLRPDTPVHPEGGAWMPAARHPDLARALLAGAAPADPQGPPAPPVQ